MTCHLMAADLGGKSGVVMIGPIEGHEQQALIYKSYRMLSAVIGIEGPMLGFVDDFTAFDPDRMRVLTPQEMVDMAVGSTQGLIDAIDNQDTENLKLFRGETSDPESAQEVDMEDHPDVVEMAKGAMQERLDALEKLEELFKHVGLIP